MENRLSQCKPRPDLLRPRWHKLHSVGLWLLLLDHVLLLPRESTGPQVEKPLLTGELLLLLLLLLTRRCLKVIISRR